MPFIRGQSDQQKARAGSEWRSNCHPKMPHTYSMGERSAYIDGEDNVSHVGWH